MSVNKILGALLLLASAGAALGCGHETKKAYATIEKDSALSAAEALQKMGSASWLFMLDKDKEFSASQREDGKYLVQAKVTDSFSGTTLTAENFLRITMLIDAKYLWRFMRAGEKRGLEEVVLSHWITATDKLELYRVRLSVAQLDAQVPAWRTADPFSVGEHDVLDEEDALAVERKIPEVWTVEVNNRDQITIGGK